MLFRRNVAISLGPVYGGAELPFRTLLNRMVSLRFDRPRCRQVFEGLVADLAIDPSLIRWSGFDDGGLLVSEAILLPSLRGWRLDFRERGRSIGFDVGADPAAVADVLRLGTQTDDLAAFRDFAEALGDETLDFICGPRERVPEWPAADRPGIYRREHASLLIRSETTSVLVDPIAMQVGLPNIAHAPFGPANEALDAILVTHSHDDHFSIPSILLNATHDVPVHVPVVPRVNLLTRVDFAGALGSLGQRVSAERWDSTFTVGDIEIDVLPFYGEQPTRDAPGPHPDLRSWGNCYRINTPRFSALLLVDAGDDPLGRMEEAVLRSRARRGPVDVVLSCLRSFPSPFFGGLDHYWASLPLQRLEELFAQLERGSLPDTTGGVTGTARACAAAGARYYLPYANGFERPEEPIADIGWGSREGSENDHVRALVATLTDLRAPTTACSWNPGDLAVVEHGRLRTAPASQVTPCRQASGAR